MSSALTRSMHAYYCFWFLFYRPSLKRMLDLYITSWLYSLTYHHSIVIIGEALTEDTKKVAVTVEEKLLLNFTYGEIALTLWSQCNQTDSVSHPTLRTTEIIDFRSNFVMPRSCQTVHVTFAAILLWHFCCMATASASKPATMKAVSYSPVPLKTMGAGLLAQDDWMVEASKPMWGLRGRDDLGIISKLGANTIRLYGNNPKLDRRSW